MGSSISLEWSINVDSVAEPGKKCVRAEFPAGTDQEALWDEVVLRMKDPTTGMLSAVLKSNVVVEHDGDPDHFTTRTVLDGVKLDSLGRGPKAAGQKAGTNFVLVYWKGKVDRKKNCMQSQIYVSEGCWEGSDRDNTDVEWTVNTFISNAPHGIESYSLNKDGEHVADDQAKMAVQDMTEKSLAAIKKRKVKVEREQDSVDTPGAKSVMTGPMDEFISFKAFFTALIKKVKEKAQLDAQQDSQITIDEKGKFQFTFTLPVGPLIGEGQTPDTQKGHTQITWDDNNGKMNVISRIGDIPEEWHYRMHKDPLRFEAWLVVDGQRKSDRGVAVQAQMYVDEIIEGSQSWFKQPKLFKHKQSKLVLAL